MSTPRIEGFYFDDENERKLWVHGLTPERVLEVLDAPIAIKHNRKDRSAPYLVIGSDYQGQCLAIPVMPTHDPRIWRPVTAWFCKPSEWAFCPRAT